MPSKVKPPLECKKSKQTSWSILCTENISGWISFISCLPNRQPMFYLDVTTSSGLLHFCTFWYSVRPRVTQTLAGYSLSYTALEDTQVLIGSKQFLDTQINVVSTLSYTFFDNLAFTHVKRFFELHCVFSGPQNSVSQGLTSRACIIFASFLE